MKIDSKETTWYRKNDILPLFRKSILCNGKLYFCAYNYNGLFSINLETGWVMPENMFGEDEIENDMLIGSMLVNQNRIYFSPVLSKKIYVYDWENNDMRVVKPKTTASRKKTNIIKTYSLILNVFGSIFLIPATADSILKINSDSTYEEFVNLKQKYKECLNIEYKYYSDGGFYLFKDKIYIPVEEKPIITIWGDQGLIFHELIGGKSGFVRAFGYEGKMCLLSHDGEVMNLDIETMQIVNKIKLERENRNFEDYRATYCKNGMGYFLSYTSNTCIKIDLWNFRVEIAENEIEWEINYQPGEKFYFTYAGGESLYFISNFNRLAIVNESGTNILTLKYDLEGIRQYVAKGITDNRDGKPIVERDKLFCLDTFIEGISQLKDCEEEKYDSQNLYKI